MALNDLNIDSSQDKDYFLLTIKDLSPAQTYPIQFRWKRKDGTFGEWSPARTITPPSEDAPGVPNVTVNGLTPGMITVSWDGKDTAGNTLLVKEVDVYFSGSPFNASVPAVILTKASTVQQTAPAGQYGVTAYAITARGSASIPKIISGGVEVTSAAVPVEAPTLPTNLTAVGAPFSLSVKWDGSYSGSDTFEGFKSIDIYASTDVGATTTTMSATKLVGSLTVDKNQNIINIGLDNLRQALSLPDNATAYTTDFYLYYIAVNSKDVKYSVSGTPTYTRINSTAVRPIKANFVDLASGVISIENLTAGTGNFASYLRVGSSQTTGGARIELSGVNDVLDANTGRTVKRGLTAYDSSNNEVLRFDYGATTPALTITGGGKFTGDLEVGSGESVFKSDTNGIYLGSSTWAGAANTFRVSRSGYLTASSGKIGGIDISSTALGSSTFSLSSTGLALGTQSGTLSNVLVSSSGIRHRGGLSNGVNVAYTADSGRFTFDASTGYISIVAGADPKTGARIIFDNDGIRAYNSSNTKTIDINSAGSAEFSGNIKGSAITGSSFVAASGTKTTTISNNATISIVDTGTDWLSGGAFTLTSGGKSLVLGSTGISIDGAVIFTNGGLGGYAENDLVITAGTDTLHLGGYSETGYVQANKHLNSPSSVISAGSNSATPDARVTGAFMSSGGTVVSRRLNGIPAWFGRFGTTGTVEAVRFLFSSLDTAGSMVDAGGININSAGNPAFRSLSDYRLKENIVDYSDGLNKINLTKVRSFVMKSDETRSPQVGFVAHELAEAFPEFVQGEKDAVDQEGSPEYQSIMTTNLIPYLVSAIKELSASVDLIKKRLDALEG